MRKTRLSILGGLAALMAVSAGILARQPATQGFSVAAHPSTAMAIAGGPAVGYTLVLTSQGYSGRVSLSCESTAPGVSCSVSPNSLEINSELAAAVKVPARAAAGVAPGNYTLVIRAVGVGNNPIEQSTAVTLEVTPVP
jgi:hypothetical protein